MENDLIKKLMLQVKMLGLSDDAVDIIKKNTVLTSIIISNLKTLCKNPTCVNSDDLVVVWSIKFYECGIGIKEIQESFKRIKNVGWFPNFTEYVKKYVLSVDYDRDYVRFMREINERTNLNNSIEHHCKLLYNVYLHLSKRMPMCDFFELNLEKSTEIFKRNYEQVLEALIFEKLELKDIPARQLRLEKSEVRYTKDELESIDNAIKEIRKMCGRTN